LIILKSAVRRASDYREYMRPQFDAFTRARPNASIRITEIADPLAGKVTLTYDGSSNEAYFFDLQNHSARTVSFAGETHFWSDTAETWAAAFSCSGGATSSADAEGVGFFDGGSRNVVKVLAGHRQRLSIRKSEVTAKHLGGRCTARLELDNLLRIESKEFSP
jgi:hypothetical protein